MNALEYLIEAVQVESFGKELYPEIYNKAAVYAFQIIKNHVFHDGNKRTGIAAAFAFLGANGLYINETITSDDLIELAHKIIDGSLDLDKLAAWFRDNSHIGVR